MKRDPDHRLVFPAKRTTTAAEALAWMSTHTAAPHTSVVTSLPDVSETPMTFPAWQDWFVDAATAVINWVPKDGLSIFYQSDIRHEGFWVDKGYLIMKAAELADANVVWHKIICRKPAGTIAMGRASYSHMICVMRRKNQLPGKRPGPDVLAQAGPMLWSRAMGEYACREACRFLRDETATKIIVDPFCGKGSVLAVANAFGFEAVGVDLSRSRARTALQCRVQEHFV